MKKILKWMGIGFAGLVIISGCNEGGTQASPEQKREIYAITAQQLFSDYESNEVAADEKMRGKLIQVKGTVQSIDKDFTDSIVVTLRTSNEFMPARMEIGDAQKAQAVALKKGQKITIQCEAMSRLVGSPSGSDCRLAD